MEKIKEGEKMDLQREFSVRIKFPLRLRGKKAKGGGKTDNKNLLQKPNFSSSVKNSIERDDKK